MTEPINSSFNVVCKALNDPLLKAKLHFFICIARQLQPYMKLYLSDSPMIPFLSSDISVLVKSLMSRFVKPDVLSLCQSVLSLTELEFTDKKNQLDPNKVDVGFTASRELLSLKAGIFYKRPLYIPPRMY